MPVALIAPVDAIVPPVTVPLVVCKLPPVVMLPVALILPVADIAPTDTFVADVNVFCFPLNAVAVALDTGFFGVGCVCDLIKTDHRLSDARDSARECGVVIGNL